MGSLGTDRTLMSLPCHGSCWGYLSISFFLEATGTSSSRNLGVTTCSHEESTDTRSSRSMMKTCVQTVTAPDEGGHSLACPVSLSCSVRAPHPPLASSSFRLTFGDAAGSDGSQGPVQVTRRHCPARGAARAWPWRQGGGTGPLRTRAGDPRACSEMT